MQYLTDDLRITGMQEVSAPEALMAELPISSDVSSLVFRVRQEISEIINGRDDRLLVIVGPCSLRMSGLAMNT